MELKARLEKLGSGLYAAEVHRDCDFSNELRQLEEKFGEALPIAEGTSTMSQMAALFDGSVPAVPGCIGKEFLLRCGLARSD